MANWRKQSGIPYIKASRHTDSAIATANGNTVLETISFSANELKVGDIISLYAIFEGTFVTANPAMRLNTDTIASGTRLLSIGLASSGTRGYSVYKEWFVSTPTTLRQISENVLTGIGGGNFAVENVVIDIAAGVDFIFNAQHASADDSSHISAYSLRVTR